MPKKKRKLIELWPDNYQRLQAIQTSILGGGPREGPPPSIAYLANYRLAVALKSTTTDEPKKLHVKRPG